MALEVKTSMLFNLDFPNKTFLSCFCLCVLIIDLYFLISVAIAKIFSPTEKLVIPIGIQTNEVKAEIEINPVTLKAKLRKCSI